MAQIWNVSDYSNILPGYQAGLQELGMRQANERAKLQDERIQRIEEMRQAAERAQEARMAEQYRLTLAQQQAVQRRLENQYKQNLDIDRAYALGISGLPAAPDLDPYGMAAYNRGKAERDADEAKRNPDLKVQQLFHPVTGEEVAVVVPGLGSAPRWTPAGKVVTGRITKKDLMGNESETIPTFWDTSSGRQLFVPPAGATGGAVGTNAPVAVPRYEIDPATGRPRRVR